MTDSKKTITRTVTVTVADTTTTRWLDQCKEKLGGISDYALAPHLGITRGMMSAYRQGKSFFSDEVAIRVATILEVDPRPIIAEAHAERATSEEQRAFWQRWAAAGLAAFAIGGGGLVAPSPAQAGQIAHDAGPLCIMSNIKWIRLRRRPSGRPHHRNPVAS